MGGSDDPSNIEELTVEEHAEAHRQLYEQHGHWEDWVAWQGLAKLIGKEDILRRVIMESNSRRKGLKYRQARRRSDGLPFKPVGTIGRRWYHDPSNPSDKACFLQDQTPPDGWKLGQGRKAKNPGLNFHPHLRTANGG
jgi:hypothetical protein